MTIPVTLGVKQMKSVKQTKHLGVYLNENLKYDQHIEGVCSNIRGSCGPKGRLNISSTYRTSHESCLKLVWLRTGRNEVV